MLNNSFILENFNTLLQLKNQGADESNTREKVIINIIKDLGFDFNNINEVISNYRIENNEEIDYVIFKNINTPLILLEAKKISKRLSKTLNKSKKEKYKKQLEDLNAQFCIITNGLSFIIYINDKYNNKIHRCSSIEIDLFESEYLSKANIAKISRFYDLFSKNNVINNKTYDKLLKTIKNEKKYNKVIDLFLNPNEKFLSFLSEEIQLKRSFLANNYKNILDLLSENDNKHNYIEKEPYMPIKGKYGKLALKMTSTNKESKKWRKKLYRYIEVWTQLKSHRKIHENQLQRYLDKVLDGPQGKGAFMSYYTGKPTDSHAPILIKQNRTDYCIAPKLAFIYDDFYKLMIEENKQKNIKE